MNITEFKYRYDASKEKALVLYRFELITERSNLGFIGFIFRFIS